jgi:hypothetical protein
MFSVVSQTILAQHLLKNDAHSMYIFSSIDYSVVPDTQTDLLFDLNTCYCRSIDSSVVPFLVLG